VTQTDIGGVTQTATPGVTHTVFEATKEHSRLGTKRTAKSGAYKATSPIYARHHHFS